MAEKKQMEIEGTERKYPPGIKRKLTKLQNSRETKAEAHVDFKKSEADLLQEMEKEGLDEVVDDSGVPPYVIRRGVKKTLKKAPWRAPKAQHVEDEDEEKKPKAKA